MQRFKTNYGHRIEAADIGSAANKEVEKLQAIASETIGCRLAIHSTKRFTVPRHDGVQGIYLVFIPDLPDFVSRLMTSIPRIEMPFSVTAEKNPAGGDSYKIENSRPDGLPYLYRGEWEAIASQHAYFTAACNAVKSGDDPDRILITQPVITEGHMHGIVTCNGSAIGSVHASGTKLPNKKSKA